jgi:uncharacterized protein involved in copper resistance
MRRPWTRLLATCWALWFAVITVGPGGFGACQEHPFGHEGGHGGHATAADASPGAPPLAQTAPPGHDHHALGSTHLGADVSAHADAQRPAEGAATRPAAPAHNCTCLGACCMLAPGVLPDAPALLNALLTAPPTSPTPAYRAIIAARRVFSQPYAIGPPATAIS